MNRKAQGVIILFFISAVLFTHTVCRGYILPSEQLIQFMVKKCSQFKTLVITQVTEVKIEEHEGEGMAYTSKIWMKSPNLYRDEILEKSGKEPEKREHSYLQLFMAKDEQRLRRFLLSMGIELTQVAFTRIDGVVAYRIGSKDPWHPKIVIEKERFLPLLITYLQPGQTPDGITTIRFSDYRKVDEGWFPYEIIRMADGKPLERQVVQSLQANTVIDPAIFEKGGQTFVLESAGEDGPSEDDRLRRVIRSFEKKYSPQSPQ
jgi:hypothetical protein